MNLIYFASVSYTMFFFLKINIFQMFCFKIYCFRKKPPYKRGQGDFEVKM